MTWQDLANEMARLSESLEKSLSAVIDAAKAAAQAEADYRKGKAEAWVQVKIHLPDSIAKEREAWVDSQTRDLRFQRDMHEAVRVGALEAIRSRRTQISALQTLANAHQAEAEFDRTGPR